MPFRPFRPCSISGCAGFQTRGKFCQQHGKRYAKIEQDRKGTAAARGYNGRWVRYRKIFLAAHPVCAKCGRLATDVDHIIAARRHKDFWDNMNHQALCHSCHSRKTVIEDGGFGKTKWEYDQHLKR